MAAEQSSPSASRSRPPSLLPSPASSEAALGLEMPVPITSAEPALTSDVDSDDGSGLSGLPSEFEWTATDAEINDPAVESIATEPIDPDLRARLIVDLRELGPSRVLDKYHWLSISTILAHLDLILPPHVTLPEHQLLDLFRIAASRIIPRRERLSQYETIDDAVRLIRSSSNIVVLTGAGVSTSCGIPDFRSADGLYAQLRNSFDELDDPHQMFDLRFFTSNPKIFYSFAKHIFPSNFTPSLSHRFLKLLEHKGKLLRNYTQNIDTLETQAGVQNVIQCHGSFATATCLKCRQTYPGSAIEQDILNGQVVLCLACAPKRSASASSSTSGRGTQKKKRRKTQDGQDEGGWGPGSSEEGEGAVREDWIAKGIVKPDITFFGEKLSAAFDDALDIDRQKVDLLIVIGTSLRVAPVSELVDCLPSSVPQILINREPISHCDFDICLLGNADIVVSELCRRLEATDEGWDPDTMRRFERRTIAPPCDRPAVPSSVEPVRLGRSHVWLFEGANDTHRWLDKWRADENSTPSIAPSA
ncbi:hypothetical protein CROQUDRAFT_661478 [Cronartium quercuum f. sp. fusiforme G11]|uniref:Deacetylase sirtuin-type domain-containing protein n=1 Tax=Cronartium quercuum f. sp. fusiforme G11 TaxID=708437 RepID=A0A9P6NGJ3_9BASI|nr:hypothetical protein CROQUDRAFT_661478 [Cronartium quercuum f. sp. fusiforme G11]